ncbi:TetR/AcrR family transcriptional regulator [Nocardia puris]|nr:TetR/AcrR family transcriptional regulator [Nocardia puris]MBF6366940.1 TetR/AcrR family transcriptional regulator [Nocardia puris]
MNQHSVNYDSSQYTARERCQGGIDIATSAGPTRRQLQAARTTSELKSAARAVFARQGYLNTKISDITAEAGRAAGSFYNHFQSKEDILAALADDIGADADVRAERTPATRTGDDPAAALRRTTRAHLSIFWHTFAANRDVIAAMDQAALAAPAFAERMRAFRAEQLRPWVAWLGELAAAGVRLPADPEVTAGMIAAAAESMVRSWTGDPERGIDSLVAFFVDGLRAGRG